MYGAHGIGADGIGRRRSGDAEVRHFHFPVCGNDNVLRFHIAVHDALVVGGSQAHSDLNRYTGRLTDGKLSFFDDVFLQGNAFHEFHDDVVIALIFSYIINIDNIWVGQAGCGLCLSPELGNECAVALKLRFHHLHGDITVQFPVHCFIYIGHPAGPDAPDDLIPTC